MYVQCTYLHIVHVNLFQLTRISHNAEFSGNKNVRYRGIGVNTKRVCGWSSVVKICWNCYNVSTQLIVTMIGLLWVRGNMAQRFT